MRITLAFLFISFVVFSCKKDEKVNPFDLVVDTTSQGPNQFPPPDPASIAGLHQYIFAPTCANSGCHDGTFEPDFRTIESSYNTLVLQPVIKNNPSGTYNFRVVPGNESASIIIERLINDIDGQSGIMPLSIDPGSDWESKRQEHINNLKAWINAGAKDVFGNSPTASNLPPQLKGIFISATGSQTPFPRNVQTSSIEIPPGTPSVDVYLACADDNTPTDQLQYLKAKVSASMNDFSAEAEENLTLVSPITQTGYDGNPVEFRFKFSVSLSGIPNASARFIRAYIQDSGETPTEIPVAASAEYIKRYYSFQIGN
ncbi:MAG: hypothetical protein WED33_01965 [Bacteroidia bacterium]